MKITKKAGEENYIIDFMDANYKRRRIVAFPDKKHSENFGSNIETLINCRLSGSEPDLKLSQWLATLPDRVINKFLKWGLVDNQWAENRKNNLKELSEHADDFIKVLKSRGRSKDYVIRMNNRLKTIFADCNFKSFKDITKSAVEIYSGKLKKDKGFSDTSRGHYLSALQGFLNWAHADGRLQNNPITFLEKPKRDSKRKGVLTPEQFQLLITVTSEKNILLADTTGEERAILYLLAGCTGLRRNELLCLTWDDINLGINPYVRVRASTAKNGKEAKQPIPDMVAHILAAFKTKSRARDSDRVFVSMDKWINTADLIRADLKTANIEPCDCEGNEIVFHSLRNSYISFLANSDTPFKTVQQLARHSDPKLTFNTYARTFEESEQKAVKALPNIDLKKLPNFCQNRQSELDKTGQDLTKNADDAEKKAVLVHETIPPRGVEPLSHG